MGSESAGRSSQQTKPGTLSPVTATLLDLFGAKPTARGGQFIATDFGQGGAFNTSMFSALPGLLRNLPLNETEQRAIELQPQGFEDALLSRDIMRQAAGAMPALLETDPKASIAAARRGFSEETLPAILEKAPGFSSSDLQRELTRAGTDLETNIAALKEANLGRVGQVVQGTPAFAQSLGTNLLDVAAQTLGFGQLGRELIRDTSEAGDAFRVLTALHTLTGPGFTSAQIGRGSNSSKGTMA